MFFGFFRILFRKKKGESFQRISDTSSSENPRWEFRSRGPTTRTSCRRTRISSVFSSGFPTKFLVKNLESFVVNYSESFRLFFPENRAREYVRIREPMHACMQTRQGNPVGAFEPRIPRLSRKKGEYARSSKPAGSYILLLTSYPDQEVPSGFRGRQIHISTVRSALFKTVFFKKKGQALLGPALPVGYRLTVLIPLSSRPSASRATRTRTST